MLRYKKRVSHLSDISNFPVSHAAVNEFVLMHWVSTLLGPELGLRNTDMGKVRSLLCHPPQPMETADVGTQRQNRGPALARAHILTLHVLLLAGKLEKTGEVSLNTTTCNRGIHVPHRKNLKDFDFCI